MADEQKPDTATSSGLDQKTERVRSGTIEGKDEEKPTHPGHLRRSTTVDFTKEKEDLTSQQKETVKAKLNKMKAARTERGGRLHGIYRVVIEMVAFYLDEDPSFVEEGVVDAESHVEVMEHFVTPGGPQAILFNCAERPLPPQDSGRFFPGVPKQTLMKRVIVADCSGSDLPGTTVLVYRVSENRNSTEDLLYSVFHVDDENPAIIGSAFFIHDLVTKPQLASSTMWGDINKSVKGPENKKNFLDDFAGYVHFLKMTKTDLDGAVKFESDPELFNLLKDPEVLMKQVTELTVINQAETVVRAWMKKIEWVPVLLQSHRKSSRSLKIGNSINGP